MQLENGDYIENSFKEVIEKLLPKYETIWGLYIGHDGKGKMISLNGILTHDKEEKRITFAEHFYTCIESIVCMNSLVKIDFTFDIANPEKYINVLNTFIAFQAHAGRIKDCAEKMLQAFFENSNKGKELIQPLKDFYAQRNQVLHGKKLPIRLVEEGICIVPPMGSETDLGKWSSKMGWADIDDLKQEFLDDYLRSMFEKICELFNNIIASLEGDIRTIIKKHKIDLDRIVDTDAASNGLIGPQGPIPIN